MSETRARMARLRAVAAFLFGIMYVVGTLFFLLILADRSVRGALHAPALALAGWFVLLMIAGLVAIWVYPYEHPSRRMRVFGKAGRLSPRTRSPVPPG